MTTLQIIIGIGIVIVSLSFVAEPLRKIVGTVAPWMANLFRRAVGPDQPPDQSSRETGGGSQLPEWIREPNDLQLMLLHLGNHAAKHGNDGLKVKTFALMKSFAELQVQDATSSPGKAKAKA